MDLESIGADTAVRGAFETYAGKGLVLARIATAQRELYRAYTEMGEVEAEPSGGLWYRASDQSGMPVVGDWVAARVVASEQAIVEAVLPRRNCFARRAAGRREEKQALAANIDRVFLVCGLDGDFNPRRLERYLTLAAESRVEPVVVLNKADLCRDVPARVEETRQAAGGAPVVVITACDGGSLEQLEDFLHPSHLPGGAGVTVALFGSSGVGKSTIINRLVGEERQDTREVRASDSRGRHTTTRRELVPLPRGGALIDTPGLREVQLWAGGESVAGAFEDIAVLAGCCRFRDCSHSGEPGCAIAEALEQGSITRERWESYRKLLGEAQRHDHLFDAQRKRKWKQLHKAQRELYRLRGRK